MKTIQLFLLLVLTIFIFAGTVNSQIVVTGSNGLNATYTSFTNAGGMFAAFNLGGSQAGMTISVSITSNVITEGGANSLNAGLWNSILVTPSGARIISGTVGNSLLIFNGADNVTFDGLNSGGNSLNITGFTSSAFRMQNDASNNTLTRCTLLGASAGGGTVNIATGTTTGNLGNTVSYCNIGPAAPNFPVFAFTSNGTSSSIPNSGVINHNHIYDYTSVGITINASNLGWAITDNRLYQTTTKLYTSSITINPLNVSGGSGYTITGNIIGFADSNGTGTANFVGNSVSLNGTFPSSYSATGTPVSVDFTAITLTFDVGGTVSEIQNNTIAGIAIYTTSGGPFYCINHGSGNANFGTTTGNTFGSTTGNGSIYAASTSTGYSIIGLKSSSVNTVVIQNNTMGAIDASGTSATISGGFTGMLLAGTGTFTVSNNTIGNSTADNIRTGYMLASGNLSNAGTLTSTTGASATVQGITSNVSGSFTATGNTIRGINIGGTVTTFTGITGANCNNNTINGNFLGTAAVGLVRYSFANSGALQVIFGGGGSLTFTISIQSNDIRGIVHSVAGSSAHTYIIINNIAYTHIISSNTFTDLNVNTTGDVKFISTTSLNSGGSQTINSNSIVTAFNKAGAGGVVNGIVSSGNSLNINSVWNGNNFSNMTFTGLTAPTIINQSDGASSSGTVNHNVTNNTVSNITGGTGPVVAILQAGGGLYGGLGDLISGNTVTNITGAGSVTGISNATTANGISSVTGNTISGLSCTGLGSGVIGIISSSPQVGNIYKNKIFDLQSNNSTGTAAGITIISGVVHNIYNNLIGDLRTTTANAVNPLIGINIIGGTNVNVYYNTVLLNSTSSGTNFGSSAISAFTGTNTVLRNNIFVNTATANGTGFTAAYRRSSTTLTSYDNTSNNNLFYAGTPGVKNIIYYDGTNSDQTISAYKIRMSTRDANSVTENPTWQSTTGSSANFLKFSTGSATQIESGAVNISTYTDDYAGIIRYGNAGSISTGGAPDIGAWCLNGIALDSTGPSFTYTPFTSGSINANQTLTVTITDASGVGTGAGLPYLYWKLNSGSYTGLQATSIGSNQYTFTFGSAATSVGNTISYYIVAQDNSGIHNTSCSPSLGASGFSINPPAVSTPPTTPNSFTASAGLTGVITVGTGGTYANLTGASGFFNAVNTGIVTGNIYVSVLSDLTETGTVLLNQFTPGYRIQVRPSGSVTTRKIEGTAIVSPLPLIGLSGADLISFNGADSATNTGQYFRFVNNHATPSSTGPVFRFANDSRQDSVRNSIIESNASTGGGNALIYLFTTTGASGNDSINIDNCVLKQSAGTNAGRYLLAYNSAGTGLGSQRNSDNFITNSTFTGMLATCSAVININGSGNGDNWTIYNNKFYNDIAFTVAHDVILVNNGFMNNVTVSYNSIGGASANRSGTFYGSATAVIQTGINLYVGVTTASNVFSNTIANFGTTSTAACIGININGGKVNIGTTSGNTIGGGANPWDTCRSGASNGMITNTTATGGNVQDTVRIENNTIGNCADYSLSNDRLAGIYLNSGMGYVRNNTIRDLKSNSIQVGANASEGLDGIFYGVNVFKGQITEGNTIYNLTRINANSGTYRTYGIQYLAGTGLSYISRNRIYGITSLGTGTGANAPINVGIYNGSTATLVISNNEISLTASTLEPILRGIHSEGASTNTLLYNSVYIGGACANATNNSAAYRRETSSIEIINNNLFYNARTGGASNYAMSLASTINWSTTRSNFNSYITSDTNKVVEYSGAKTFRTFKSTAGGDSSSVSGSSTIILSSALFKNTSTGDLNLDSTQSACWNVVGLGTPVTVPSINQSYRLTQRPTTIAGGNTDIGADEIGLPSSVPLAALEGGTRAVSNFTTYNNLGRQVCRIDWGASGTVPTAISLQEFNGKNPPNSIANFIANKYYVITSTGGSGYSYDITFNYDPVLIGSISNEASLIVYKSDNGGASYTIYNLPGTSQGLYQINTTLNTVKVFGLTGFSIFGFGDGNTLLPVEISSFTAGIEKRNVNLNWTSLTEQNNSGFDIERKKSSTQSWTRVGNVEGAGNSSTPKNYSFADNNVPTGKYNYRLKQIDNNGGFLYHELSSLIEVGIPNKYEISQNYPNPFNPETKINYDLPFDSKVQIKIFDMTGREVSQLVNLSQTAGYYTVQFNASALASGVYFYQIVANGGKQTFTKTMKMVLVK